MARVVISCRIRIFLIGIWLILEIRIFRQLTYYTVVNLFIQKYISLQNNIHMVLKYIYIYNNLFNNKLKLSNRFDKLQIQ